MKKKKNKGFTMVELLAVIVIMGILMAIAIPAVLKYVNKSRNTSTETMLKSTYEAAQNYMMDQGISGKGPFTPIEVSKLVNLNYLEILKDPSGDSGRCDGPNSKVTVTYDNNSNGGISNYIFNVKLECPQSGTLMYTFPEDTLLTPMLNGAVKYAKEKGTLDAVYNGGTKDIKYTDLKNAGYISEIKDGGTSCNSTSSKVVVSYLNKQNPKYEITLVCGSKTYKGTYAFK